MGEVWPGAPFLAAYARSGALTFGVFIRQWMPVRMVQRRPPRAPRARSVRRIRSSRSWSQPSLVPVDSGIRLIQFSVADQKAAKSCVTAHPEVIHMSRKRESYASQNSPFPLARV